jgi:molecular chaperone DnaK
VRGARGSLPSSPFSSNTPLQEPDPDEATRSMPRAEKPKAAPAPSRPGSTPYGQEEIITHSGGVFDLAEDEPTKTNRFSIQELEELALEIPKPAPPSSGKESSSSQDRPALGGTQQLTQPLRAAPATLPLVQPAQTLPLVAPFAARGFGQIVDPTLSAPQAAFEAPPAPAPPEARTLGFELPDIAAAVQPAIPVAAAEIPLLVDVTPLTLVVETVQGFCDAIIDRNTPVPCSQSREFVTASDHQPLVRVRVAQGESKRFDENTLLGEVELSGLRPAPRGEVQVSVSFALDASGMLNVSAIDVATGRATRATLRLLGLPGPSEIAQMMDRQQQRLA